MLLFVSDIQNVGLFLNAHIFFLFNKFQLNIFDWVSSHSCTHCPQDQCCFMSTDLPIFSNMVVDWLLNPNVLWLNVPYQQHSFALLRVSTHTSCSGGLRFKSRPRGNTFLSEVSGNF
jgi:hypothetical protein